MKGAIWNISPFLWELQTYEEISPKCSFGVSFWSQPSTSFFFLYNLVQNDNEKLFFLKTNKNLLPFQTTRDGRDTGHSAGDECLAWPRTAITHVLWMSVLMLPMVTRKLSSLSESLSASFVTGESTRLLYFGELLKQWLRKNSYLMINSINAFHISNQSTGNSRHSYIFKKKTPPH